MLKELKTHHQEIARLSFEGYKPKEIAKKTGSKIGSIYAILRDPMCKSFLLGLNDKANKGIINVREKLAELNAKALETIEYMLDNDNKESVPASTRLMAANTTLDRNGYKAPEQHNHAHAILTVEDIKKLNNTAKDVDTTYLNETITVN